ncbi:hypothetical protein RI054_17g81480 [Pseudoscourfieldia marina]
MHAWAATGRTLEQAYAAFANEVAARVATAKHLPPLSALPEAPSETPNMAPSAAPFSTRNGACAAPMELNA